MKRLLAILLLCFGAGLPAQQVPPEVAHADAEKKQDQADLNEAVRTEGSRIEFIGLTGMPEREMRFRLAEQLRLIRAEGLTRPLADDTAFYVELFLRRLGYSQVEVRWEIIEGAKLRLTVTEGPRTFLGKIEFTGEVKLDNTILRDYLIGATRERFSGFAQRLPFVRADIDDGINRVRSYYRSEGYLESVVNPPVITFSADMATADIEVPIVAGPQYLIGTIMFEGTALFGEPELMSSIAEQAAKPYTPINVEAMRRDLQFFYTSKGYYFAKVTAIDDPSKAVQWKTPVTFVIEPGELYTFDGVTEAGLNQIRDGFLVQRFKRLKGKAYNPKILDKLYRQVMQTGLFDRLSLTKTPIEGNQIRLDFHAVEAKTKSFGIYGGVATYDGFIVGLTFEDRNLFGTGRPLNTSIELTQRGYSGEIKIVDPWFFETDYKLTARIFGERTRYEGYTSFSAGQRTEIKRKFFDHLDVSIYGQYQRVEITEAQINTIFLGPPEYSLATGGTALLLDYRDNVINPSKGWYLSTSASYNTDLQGVDYIRLTAGGSYYRTFGKILLAIGARFGTLVTDDFVGDVPITERFFNGGATTVRSFPEYELGPLDNGKYPIGGLTMTVFNAEGDFPIFDALKGAVFVDAGSVSFDTFDVQPSQMKYAMGVGLRYQLPIGPIRADYGFNPFRGENDPFGAFHFSFGFAF